MMSADSECKCFAQQVAKECRPPKPDVPAQSYIQGRRQALKSGQLFEDPFFKPVDDSIFTSKKPPRPVVWKRPGEICSDPKLFVDGAERFDINQGMLGNCWFLAGVANLTMYPKLLYRVVPKEQGWGYGYAGIFYFRFWQYGEWVDVVIDDKLPTYNNQLIFLHSKRKNEFWSALLEKAYAKLCGSYEALKGGQIGEAMEDLTGGLSERYELRPKVPDNLFQIMRKYRIHDCLMGCSIKANPQVHEDKLDNGLALGHAYSVTDVRKAILARTISGKREVELVRVRDPAGTKREWNGAWGDRSSEWRLLSDDEKRNMGLQYDNDGEFWMSFEDFIANFERLEVCVFHHTSNHDWELQLFYDRWITNLSAGGCRNSPNTFHWNPQFTVDLKEDANEDGMVSLTVALMQRNRRQLKGKLGSNCFLTIGFAIYKTSKEDFQDGRLDKEFFLNHASIARSQSFINTREVYNHFKLDPGCYTIIPSTFDPNEEGDFILRIFTEKDSPEPSVKARDDSAKAVRPTEKQPSPAATLSTKYREFFLRVAGTDKAVDAYELKNILESAFHKDIGDQDFSLETCKELVAIYGKDGDAKIDFRAFRELLYNMKKWKGQFREFDQDRLSSLNVYQLEGALKEMTGMQFSQNIVTRILTKHANKKGRVELDSYVLIGLRAKLIDKELKKRTARGQTSIPIEELHEFLTVLI